jgi:hypothetical protein
MRLRHAALGLVLVVLLAGCNGLTGPGTNATDATNGTVTSGTVAAGGFPTGVSESGAADTDALERANRRALAETGFQSELLWNVTVTSGSRTQQIGQRFVTQAGAGGEPYRTQLIQQSRQVSAQVETWSNESVRYRYAVQQSQFRGRQSTAARAYDPEPTPQNGAVGTLFTIVDWGNYTTESVAATDDGRRITLTAGTGATGNEQTTIQNYDGEVVVDASGRVHEATITLNLTTARGAQSNSTLTYQLEETGDRQVAAPNWLPTVLASTPSVRLNTTVVDGNYVRVRHAGGESLPAGTSVGLIDVGTGGAYAELPEDVTPGDDVYLYFEQGTPQTRVSLSPPSGDLRAINATQRVFVSTGSFNTTSANVTLADG